MRIFIHGYYGAGNAGDDALLHSMIDNIYAHLPHVEATVSARSRKFSPYDGPHSIRSVLGNDLATIHRTIRRSDLVLVGGGGLFQDYLGYDPLRLFSGAGGSINYYIAPLILSRILAVPAVLYAVGVGPLQSDEAAQAVCWVASMCQAVTTRDRASADVLTSLGVTHAIPAADPAVNLRSEQSPRPTPKLPARSSASPVVGINLRSWFHETPKVLQLLKKSAHYLIRKFQAKIVVLPFNRSPRELRLARTLATSLPRRSVTLLPYDHRPTVLKGICAQLDLVIGMRLHASILAMGAGTPAIGLAYDPKVERFYEEVGLLPYSIPLQSATAAKLQAVIADAMHRRDALRARLPQLIQPLQERDMTHNIGLIRRVLEKNNGGARR